MKIRFFPQMSELSLWCAWNDALNAGECPLEDKQSGEQFLGLGFRNLVMAVSEDEHGWRVTFVEEGDLRHDYQINNDPENLPRLRKAKKPFRL